MLEDWDFEEKRRKELVKLNQELSFYPEDHKWFLRTYGKQLIRKQENKNEILNKKHDS